jgi:hypothetical protein
MDFRSNNISARKRDPTLKTGEKTDWWFEQQQQVW